jgi:hypothetical protein
MSDADSTPMPAGGPHEHSEEVEDSLSNDAALLLNEHGQNADVVAAFHADSLFRRGDAVGGARWLNIFRAIAAWHLRRGRVKPD